MNGGNSHFGRMAALVAQVMSLSTRNRHATSNTRIQPKFLILAPNGRMARNPLPEPAFADLLGKTVRSF
jgi:hypothetical protein